MSVSIVGVTTKPNILNVGIRADGNSELGLGHIVRTMALAHEFRAKGHNVFYITKENMPVNELLKSNGYKIFNIGVSLNINEEVSLLNRFLKDYQIDILIGDSNNINQDYLSKVDWAYRIVVLIDVLRDMSIGADLIINGGIYAEDYRSVASIHKRKVLLGPKYNLLRNQFMNTGTHNINKNVKDVLITMGGSDVKGLTLPIIESMHELDDTIKLHVVIGNSYKNIPQIKEKVENHYNTNLYYNVEHIARLMKLSDIAISAGGTTLYELAATGTPTIAIIQAENQKLQSYRFDEKGIITLFKGDIKVEKEKFKDVVSLLINDKQRRISMSRLGQKEIDGKGAERCYEEILKTYARILK